MKKIILLISMGIALLGILVGPQSGEILTKAQGITPNEPEVSVEISPLFQLPFAAPPGPDTWLMAQPYGNTTGAYFQRNTLYKASGGIHFGVDLAAPCYTEIVAIADGVVFAVDGPFGSPPHNLMIDHSQLGYSSMYGHLIEAPSLRAGQTVKQGQVVAQVGDSNGDCNRSPHLHLEIRDLNHFVKFNPTTLIEADWNKLTMYGTFSRGFMRDLDEPRKWQQLYNQPQAQTGGPIINNFERTWPLDWSRTTPTDYLPTPTPQAQIAPTPTSLPLAQISAPFESQALPLPAGIRQISQGNCCTRISWSSDSSEIHFVDKPM